MHYFFFSISTHSVQTKRERMPVKTLEQPAGAFQISEGKAAEGDPGTGANRLLPRWPPPAGVWRGRRVMCHLRARHMELAS